MAAMTDAINATAYYMHESFDVDAPFLTPPALLKGAAAFAAAQAAVAGKDGRFARRVEEAGMPVMYVVLFRWAEVQAAATNAGTAWPYNASKSDQFAEFARRFAALNMTQLDEGRHDINWMKSQLFPGATGAAARSPKNVGSLHWPRPA